MVEVVHQLHAQEQGDQGLGKVVGRDQLGHQRPFDGSGDRLLGNGHPWLHLGDHLPPEVRVLEGGRHHLGRHGHVRGPDVVQPQ